MLNVWTAPLRWLQVAGAEAARRTRRAGKGWPSVRGALEPSTGLKQPGHLGVIVTG